MVFIEYIFLFKEYKHLDRLLERNVFLKSSYILLYLIILFIYIVLYFLG